MSRPGDGHRPRHAWTRAALTAGTLAAGACLAIGLALALLAPAPSAPDLHSVARLVDGLIALDGWAWSMLGAIVLLATPAAGLVATAVELRPTQPRSALLALAVLAVLGLAVVVALA